MRKWEKLRSLLDFWMCKIIFCYHITEHCNGLGVRRIVTKYPTSVLLSRMMKSSVHAEEDDFVPELQRSIHPRERPDWEETLSAMVKHLCHVFSPIIFHSEHSTPLFPLYSLSFSFLNGLHSTLNKARMLPFL